MHLQGVWLLEGFLKHSTHKWTRSIMRYLTVCSCKGQIYWIIVLIWVFIWFTILFKSGFNNILSVIVALSLTTTPHWWTSVFAKGWHSWFVLEGICTPPEFPGFALSLRPAWLGDAHAQARLRRKQTLSDSPPYFSLFFCVLGHKERRAYNST